MAIETEFIDFIVPIAIIRAKYPGGWERCLRRHAQLLGGRVWYDDYLFRDGAMNGSDIGSLVDQWSAMKFAPFEYINGVRHWADFCVHERMFGGSTQPCHWLVKTGPYTVAHIDDPHPEIVKHLPPRIHNED